MRYAPGTDAEFEATFTDSFGNLVDPDTIHVDIWDSEGLQVLDNGIPTQLGLGSYQYVHAIPLDAPLGLWKVEWHAVVDGLNAFGEEIFEVDPAPEVTPSDQVAHSRLRSRLGEVSKLPDDQNGSDTLFSTTDIADLLSYAEGDLDYATFEGWKRKAAHLSRLIDISESGSDRSLSQRFKQAKAMLDHWGKVLSETGNAHAGAIAGRVVGSVINMRKCEDPLPGTPFSGYTDHIRMYPTKRLVIPAILG